MSVRTITSRPVCGWLCALLSLLMIGLNTLQAQDKKADADEITATAADGRVLNLDFEKGTLEDWKAEGEAFAGQPIKGDTVAARRGDMRSAHKGDFWIGGYEKVSDPPIGTLTSVPFKVTQPFASFLANGGDAATTRVELVRKDTGEAFFKTSGENSEELKQVVVDLKDVAGKEIFIRLVDQNRGGWGHLNFDHFRFHSTKPVVAGPTLSRIVADDYPHAGLAAEQAAKAMKVPAGFQVTVGAAEPEVKQPIAMAIDDRGRVWIAEAYEYPIKAQGKGRDRILIFEDKDGNGTLESRKVFTEGLNLVSGLEIGFGGVWVGAAPELLFIPDKDGDDVPDGEPIVLLDGWGLQDTHEMLNAFIWGPDGWLYGCHGVFTHSRVGKPGTPDAERVPLNAAIWRYHPTRHTFDIFAHGTSNPWGVDFNDRGQAFCTACVIPHLFHIIQGARYQRQAGQHFNPYTFRDIVTIADHLHYIGGNPHGGNNRSDEAGGGHAHAGAMIYLGGAWPEQYRDQIFMNNIHGQRLNVDILKPRGSGYVGSHGPDFLLTGDRASQILNLRYGPDGQAWMIDWYDMQACHTGDVKAHDRSNGRIYKISAGEPKKVTVDLKKLSDLELAELTLNTNDWYVRHSRRVLQERAATKPIDASAKAKLVEIATRHEDDTRRLRAMWAMHVTGGIDAALTQKLLADPSEYVRGWMVQLSLDTGAPVVDGMLSKFTTMARDDKSQVVRIYLASAVQKLPLDQRWSILSSLAAHAEDAGDHNLPLMYWYAAEPLATVDAERALAFGLSSGPSIPLLREFMLRRIGSSDGPQALTALVRGLGKSKEAELQLTFLQAIRSALRGQRRVNPPADWAAVSTVLASSSNEQVKLQARALGVTFGDPAAMASFRELATSKSATEGARKEAVESLIAANDKGLAPTLLTLVNDPALRTIALQGMAQYDDPKTAATLLAGYSSFTPDEKRVALGTLCSRPSYALELLGAIEKKQLPGTDLTADLVRQLQFLKDEKLQQHLGSIWGTVRETAADKLKLIENYKQLVAKGGDADSSLGRAVFAKTCQRCHILYGIGNKVGPDLTGSNRANLDYLLSNIVDPSAVMAKEYQQTIIVTDNARVISGLVRTEDDKSVTIQTADSLVVIPKGEIDERILSDKSMMPDDQLKQFTEMEVRSLLAYLGGKKQVAMLATKDNAATLFNGKDLTGWQGEDDLWSVENGEIVGRTKGLAQNEFLVSELAAADFRFTVEVKLIRNEGNSGIQFRSAPAGHEVKGYQADVGVGWWGKLYEELGRGLLWDHSGESHVKNGEWNTYEIEAIGSQLRTKINGQLCVDLDDPKGARSGVFAFQLHSGGATEVRFRNLKLEVIEGTGPAK
jgi:putative membrane-bound dehydrogenase-like protein